MKERAEAGRLPKGEEEQRRNVPKKARTPCVDFLNVDIPAKAPLPKELRLKHKRHPLVSVPSYLSGSSTAFTRSYNLLSARIADMLYFSIAVNETDNAALRYGTLHGVCAEKCNREIMSGLFS